MSDDTQPRTIPPAPKGYTHYHPPFYSYPQVDQYYMIEDFSRCAIKSTINFRASKYWIVKKKEKSMFLLPFMVFLRKPIGFVANKTWAISKLAGNYWLYEPARDIIMKIGKSVRYVTMFALLSSLAAGGVYAYNNADSIKGAIKQHIPSIQIEWKDS